MQQKLKFRLFALLSFLYSFSFSQEFPVSDYTGDGIVDTIVRSKSLQFPETQIDFVMKSTHKNAQKVLFRNVGHWECYTLSLKKIRHLTHLGLPILHFNCGSEENESYYLLQGSESFQPYFLGYFFEEYSFDEYGVFQNLNPPQKVLANVFNIKEDSTWNFYWTLPGKTLLYNKPEKSATNDRVESVSNLYLLGESKNEFKRVVKYSVDELMNIRLDSLWIRGGQAVRKYPQKFRPFAIWNQDVFKYQGVGLLWVKKDSQMKELANHTSETRLVLKKYAMVLPMAESPNQEWIKIKQIDARGTEVGWVHKSNLSPFALMR